MDDEYKEVSIQEFDKIAEEYIKIYSQYCDELVEINKAENAEIDTMTGDGFKSKFEEYVQKFPDHLNNYKNQREELKKKYGKHSSYYNCDYYCVVHTEDEVNEYYKNYPDEKKGDGSGYKHNLEAVKKFKGKYLQDAYHSDVYGKFIGIAFFIDQDYYLIYDKNRKIRKFLLSVEELDKKPKKELPYTLVENGKDYL